jgi:hypothetical protein
LAEGSVTGSRLDLRTTSLVGTPTAKEVGAVNRSYELDGDGLRVRMSMAAVGEPMTDHLEAELTRASS